MSRTAVTLFSGLGSSSKALRDLGYDVLPHDFMPEAVATLRANGFTEARLADVREIDYSDPRYADVEVLVGGPPCQPFSQASTDAAGEYDERDMIPEFIRAVRETSPKLFVMEEVQTLSWARNRAYLDRVVADLEAEGYVVEHRVLNAADYGIPQARKRLFVIGVREDVAKGWVAQGAAPISWPEPQTQPQTLAQALGWEAHTAWERNQLAPEPARISGPDRRERMTYVDPETGEERRCAAWLNPILDWCYERPAMTVVGSFRPDVMAAPGYRKAGDGPRQNTLGSVVLTLEERLILQDMPADWVVEGSEAKRALQVGNSVPCGLIRELVDINIP